MCAGLSEPSEGEAMSALDAGLEVLTPYLSQSAYAVIAAKCIGLLHGYDARWLDAPLRVVSVESVMTSDLYNPDTGRKSRTFTVAGKLDVRAVDTVTGEKMLIDHKTASVDIADAGGSYWQQLVVEGQASHYLLLEWLNANKVDYAVWDVIRKPGIAPRILTKATMSELKGAGAGVIRAYYSQPVSDADLDALETDPRETPAMFASRLAYDCAVERPDWYFQRRKIPRLDSEVREYAQDLWGNAQDILTTRANGRWLRNSGACMLYGSPCKFLGLCSGHDTLDSGKWTTKEWVHGELPRDLVLPDLKGRGTDVLTNSRIRCFQTCRRKHELQYEIGVEKVDEEEREALWFGSLFHSALEQYFLNLQLQQKG